MTDSIPSSVEEEDAKRQPDHDFVDHHELAARLRVHPRTIKRMVERGELPKPCMGGGGRPRWLWEYVIDYCMRRHERDAELDKHMGRKLN